MNPALTIGWRLRVLATVLIVPPLLHLRSLERLAAGWPLRRPASAPPVPLLEWDVERWMGLLPWPWHRTCLKRAGVLYALLRRAGVAVTLQIGVRRDATGALLAHAWLVRDGVTYLEPPSSDVTTYRLIAAIPDPRADGGAGGGAGRQR